MGEGRSSALGELQDFPKPACTSAYYDQHQRRLPQCIAHRGYSSAYPENTLAAFKAAVEVGAHAFETDVQVTRDDTVVISHDPTLQSQFGRPGKIADYDWSDLQDLKTTKSPHEAMPRLEDVLRWLSQPGMEEIWIMLEIKVCADPGRIMRLVNSTIHSIPTQPQAKAWNERIVLCLLPASYLVLAAEYLPGFPIAHLGFSRSYVRQLFAVPNISFSVASPLLILPGGHSLLTAAQKTNGRQVYTWVVNEEETMKWCIRRGLDGVVCDDPKKFLEICRSFDANSREPWFLPLRMYWKSLVELWFMARRAWSARKILEIPLTGLLKS